jgi:hypothetical protein
MIILPFTFSIPTAAAFGLLFYVALYILTGKFMPRPSHEHMTRGNKNGSNGGHGTRKSSISPHSGARSHSSGSSGSGSGSLNAHSAPTSNHVSRHQSSTSPLTYDDESPLYIATSNNGGNNNGGGGGIVGSNGSGGIGSGAAASGRSLYQTNNGVTSTSGTIAATTTVPPSHSLFRDFISHQSSQAMRVMLFVSCPPLLLFSSSSPLFQASLILCTWLL